ncbi:Eukaryotic aspartyl protease [Phytophthora infestans]|uniref:Eukaryotic aspartyl protease n=1 Tax=Phytophthora infestans TaxID=4787 RepID=A0A833WR37_PHYIN|nr:Eukaryotic aspartyl protease [Phytophthora infestans]
MTPRRRNSLLRCLALLLLGRETQAASAHYSLDLTGIASGTAYTLTVDIGTVDGSGSSSGNNAFRLIADTGSSNDAVLGTGCCGSEAEVTYSCDASSTCTNAGGDVVTLAFAGANIQGQLMTDTWSSAEIGDISKTFLVIEKQDTFYRSTYDGITGLAYEALAASTGDTVSSLYNVLVNTAKSTDAFGMLLCGTMQPMLQTGGTDFTHHSGQLLIGGTEGIDGETYYSGDMLYTPITREAWYVVTVTDIGYNGASLGFSCENYNEPQAIVDSGTSNLAFPSDVYNALMDQIKTATLEAIPDFDASYFDDSASCCDEDYCDPTSSSAALLQLPSIYFTLGMETSDGSTSKHFTVEIPPEYYWRPEMNGDNSSMACRAIGISEGTSTVLGDVFMDGLYSYHDRVEGKIGLAVANNCPNNVTSSKKVYTSEDSTDWCSCFSSTLKKKSSWTTFLPWGSGCFFWLWWMYIVIASFVVVIACVGVLLWWHMTNKRMKKLQEEACRSNTSGRRTTRLATMQSSGSRGPALAPASPHNDYYVAPTSTPQRRSNRSGRSGSRHGSMKSPRSQDRRSKRKEKEMPIMAEPKYSTMSSPRSPLSDTSSIALLSEPNSSVGSMESWKHKAKPYTPGNHNSNYKASYNDRWGASLKESEF